MVNYACAFSQSELGKYFEWMITLINFFTYINNTFCGCQVVPFLIINVLLLFLIFLGDGIFKLKKERQWSRVFSLYFSSKDNYQQKQVKLFHLFTRVVGFDKKTMDKLWTATNTNWESLKVGGCERTRWSTLY